MARESKSSSSSSSDDEEDTSAPSAQRSNFNIDGTTPPNAQSPAVVIKSSQPTCAAILSSSLPQKKLEEDRRNALTDQAALLAAAKANDTRAIKDLLDKKVDINRPDGKGYTPLHHAAMLGNLLAAHMLLDWGADDTMPTKKEGYTAIMLAALKRREHVVELLADRRRARDRAAGKQPTADPGSRLPTGATPYPEAKMAITLMEEPDRVETFKVAVTTNDIVMAARMLASGNMTLSECDEHGDTPLVLATKGGGVEMIMLLLCNGAKTYETDKEAKSPLMHAAAGRNLPAIKVLLRAGADASQPDVDDNNALDLAVANDDAAVLDALLGGKDGGGKLRDKMPALIHSAARAGKTRAVALLLKRKVDVRDKSGCLALAVMARSNQVAAVKTLLAAGANPHDKARDGHTAFTLAAANGHTKIVKALFAHCPLPFSSEDWVKELQNETDRQGRTALMLAVMNRQHKMFVLLNANNADKNKTDRNGRNAMLWAAAKGGRAMVNELLLKGASPFVSDTQGNTVLLIAARYGDKEVVKFFCTAEYAGSSLNIHLANKDGDTPLILAARHGHLKLVKFLLDKQHVNPLHHNKQGRTAFLEAGGHNHREVMALMQQSERDMPMVYPVMDAVVSKIVAIFPTAKRLFPALRPQAFRREDKAGNSVLHLMAENGHRELMQQLLAARPEQKIDATENPEAGQDQQTVPLLASSSGAIIMRPANLDIEMTNKEGMTPLCLAARNGHYSAVSYLVEQHAQVNHASVTGMTPLWLACRVRECAAEQGVRGQTGGSRLPLPVDLVRLLLEHEALVDGPSFRGQTPLMAASACGEPAVVCLLISAGADVNRADDYGLRPLMYAAHFGHVEVATILLEEGAAPDPSTESLSALILAAESGRDDVVRLLIERGALVDHVDKYGLTALMTACTAGNETTVELLLKMGADPLFVNEAVDMNAMDYAKKADHYAITQILENFLLEVADC